MRRAYDFAVLSIKQLLADYRMPTCQPVHTEALLASRATTAATFCRGTPLDRSHALVSNCSGCAWPDAVKAQGSCLYQHNLVSYFATQCQHTQQECPDINLLDPALQKQWDHARNAHLGKTVIKPLSDQHVWWCCDKCPDGYLHSWSARINNRSSGSGCPQCSGRKVCKHNSLATRAPKVAAEWDYQANTGTPESVVAHSSQICGWYCDACGHKWQSAPVARVRRDSALGCPVCTVSKEKTKHPTFAECQHPLLAEWDHDRNAAHGNCPDNVTLGSGKRIFWMCTKCPAGQVHSWSAPPVARLGHNRTGITERAVHSVLGGLLADATPCKHYTLT
ncbi:hypothetical protein ABBQ38_008304 [Trebouxia sp. C0009 RCD-2024]